MKKNIAMRIAAFLFILTMISTCAFATTFAKYVTSGSSIDEARVAKWGVEVVAVSGDGLFASSYGETVVSSDADVDVVAPGTSGNLAGFTVSGAPEVDVEVTYSATLTLAGWVVDGTDYCPIIFTINGEEITGATMAELKTAVEAKIAAASATYDANETIEGALNVSWSWAYSTSNADDVKDTALGDAATAPTIKLDVTCTVTQID